MRILPVNYNIFIPKLSEQKSDKSLVSFSSTPVDTFEISFKGSSFLDEAKTKSGIHCPVCGVRMLDKETYDSIIDKFSQVKDKKDFVELMNEYKDFIPVHMRNVAKNTIDTQNPTDLKTHVQNLNKRAYFKHCYYVEKSNNYLKEYLKDYPEEKQNELNELLSNIKPGASSYTYMKQVVPFLKSLNLQPVEFYIVSENSYLSLRNSSNYYSVFKFKDIDSMSDGEISAEIASKVFGRALSHYSKISRTMYEDNPANAVLTCENCNKLTENSKTFITYATLSRPNLKDNIKTYINDVFMMTDSPEITNMGRSYILFLTRFIENISKKGITFDETEIKDMSKIGKIASRHEAFLPIAQSKVDIPCAGCGSTLLPHSVKKEQIEKDLASCSKISSYEKLLVKYDKYIGRYARPAADIFLEVAKESQGLSKDEFVKIVQAKMDKYTDKAIKEEFKTFNKIRTYVVRHNSQSELELFDTIQRRLFDYVSKGKLKPDYNYMKMLDETISDIDINKAPALLYTVLNNLKIRCFENSITKLNEYDCEKDKDPIQSIVFKIFNSGTATADHLVAKAKGGEYSKDNIIGLCKACNKIVKGNKNLYSWVIQNSETRVNLPKHVHVVDDMYKQGLLDEGYANWAKSIAQKVYSLTYNKLDFRDEF